MSKKSFVDIFKNVWGSNQSIAFKAGSRYHSYSWRLTYVLTSLGAWAVAGLAFYGSTKLFDNRKLSQSNIEQHNKKILEELKNKESK
jgi:hypothetical protein